MNRQQESIAAAKQPLPIQAATFRELVRFVAVGMISSVGYALVFIVLAKGFSLHPQAANHLALLVAAVWSYYGHSRITFEHGAGAYSAWKFATQIVVFYLLSAAVYFVVARLGLDPIWGVAICFILIPASSYAVMKLWTFARPAAG
jgi:putative flippase GtrA